jgi:nitrogenase molybdenum-iron protein NifN
MIAPNESFTRTGDGENEPYPNATTNACKLCTPLGACLAFRGVQGAIPFLHGSQGCATYIRRYLISHFREPMDIAASNFSESSAVFGGADNLKTGLTNVLTQYKPALVGLATTCLSETIGEDMKGNLRAFAETPAGQDAPPIVSVSTASFRGTHIDGFHSAVRGLIDSLCPVVAPTVGRGSANSTIAIFPGMVSPADLRELKRLVAAFDLPLTLLPDYSDTLDGPSWADYEKLPSGGTPVESIRALSHSRASFEFGRVLAGADSTAATILARRHGVLPYRIGAPIGLLETDRFTELLTALSGRPMPAELAAERGRLIDSWVDGHKYVFEKRAIVYGEEDLVIGLASLLAEIGIVPVLCASGGRSGRLAAALRAAAPELDERTIIREGADFADIADQAEALKPDFLIGASKGYSLARKLGVPLIRCGFPIHDRIGGQRILHLGYAGAQALYDRIVNTLLERKQGDSPIGYSYL